MEDPDPTELELVYTQLAAQVNFQKSTFFSTAGEEQDSDRGSMSFYKNSFLLLKDYRVLCFDKIIQCVFFFLGYTKQDINIPGTNIMDWNRIKKKLITEQGFFEKMSRYDFHGPKGAVKSYQMTNYLLAETKRMDSEGYIQSDVDEYNLGYGRIWQWFKYVLECRIKDILLRRQQKDILREAR